MVKGKVLVLVGETTAVDEHLNPDLMFGEPGALERRGLRKSAFGRSELRKQTHCSRTC